MKKSFILLVLSLSALQLVFADGYGSSDVCDIEDDDAAADACSMKKSFGGSPFFQQYLTNFNPSGALYVRYGNVVLGGAQQLSPSRIYSQPSLSLALVGSGSTNGGAKKYSFACVDFQVTSKSSKAIWTQTGLVANAQTGSLASAAKPNLAYASPNPPANSGTHEYIFLLFQESQSGPNFGALLAGATDIKALLQSPQIKSQLIAASYFKSKYDGIPIRGQRPGQNTVPIVIQVPPPTYKPVPILSPKAPQNVAKPEQAHAPAVAPQKAPGPVTLPQKAPVPVTVPQKAPVQVIAPPKSAAPLQAHSPAPVSNTHNVITAPKADSHSYSNPIGAPKLTPPAPVANTHNVITVPKAESHPYLNPIGAPKQNVGASTPAVRKPIENVHQSTLPTVSVAEKNYGDVCASSSDAAYDACGMISAFGGSSITPKVFPSFKPAGALYVQYGNVVLGGAQQMVPSRVRAQPSIKFSVGVTDYHTAGKKYFLILVDTVELTSSVSVSWAQTGISLQGSSDSLNLVSGSTLCKYLSPLPSPGETRNYVFLLFEQPNGSSIPAKYSSWLKSVSAANHNSLKLNLHSFISDSGLGAPVGGSFFKSQGSYRSHHTYGRSQRGSLIL